MLSSLAQIVGIIWAPVVGGEINIVALTPAPVAIVEPETLVGIGPVFKAIDQPTPWDSALPSVAYNWVTGPSIREGTPTAELAVIYKIKLLLIEQVIEGIKNLDAAPWAKKLW